MNTQTKGLLQNRVNESFVLCERLKDEIAVLEARYKATAAYLHTLVEETGIHPETDKYSHLLGIN